MVTFDYIIIGAGAAGLHLSMALKKSGLLKNRKLLILEPSAKDRDDKTWCYWEKNSGNWDHVVTKSWRKGEIVAKDTAINFDLKNYRYKMLRSIDFYDACKDEIAQEKNILWAQEKVTDCQENQAYVCVKTNANTYNSSLVFDSRIPSKFYDQNDSIHLHQHFKGWYIQTKKPCFDADFFTMMDFTVKDKNTTSFTYVLPVSQTEALVEFTYFSPDIVADQTYEHHLKTYLKHRKINNYNIISEEKGVIPMSSFDFDAFPSSRIHKIGTAAGWVKASTGYAFKNCERKSQEIIDYLKADKDISKLKKPLKYKHYDKMFLDVLKTRNEFGEDLFYKMYSQNPIERIFRFLDEESTLTEDLKIILSLNSSPFHHAFLRHLKRGLQTS